MPATDAVPKTASAVAPLAPEDQLSTPISPGSSNDAVTAPPNTAAATITTAGFSGDAGTVSTATVAKSTGGDNATVVDTPAAAATAEAATTTTTTEAVTDAVVSAVNPSVVEAGVAAPEPAASTRFNNLFSKPGRILVGVPTYNRVGYVQLLSRILKLCKLSQHGVGAVELRIFDDASSQYGQAQLRHWFPDATKVYVHDLSAATASASRRAYFCCHTVTLTSAVAPSSS
jgi:hypothetical protein